MGAVLNYQEELTKAMSLLAEHPKTLFVGQAVRYDGQRAHATFAGVPMEKRIEMPVCEDFQMGFCTGLALEGYMPICFFPRWDFAILACNQIVNHLDKIPLLGDFKPKVIIRTAVGANAPLNPGPQHTQNHTDAFRLMLRTIPIFELRSAEVVMPRYREALHRAIPSILVERMDRY
jgi:pyruvate/2-oxoglutarate/acetoin dehydrogenase E1 component